MLAAVAVAKIAGISTLLILAWFVVKIVRGGPPAPSAPAEGPAPDLIVWPETAIVLRPISVMKTPSTSFVRW